MTMDEDFQSLEMIDEFTNGGEENDEKSVNK